MYKSRRAWPAMRAKQGNVEGDVIVQTAMVQVKRGGLIEGAWKNNKTRNKIIIYSTGDTEPSIRPMKRVYL